MTAYVAGAFDWGSTLRIRVRKANQYKINYTIEPTVEFRKKNGAVMGLLDEWCNQHGVEHTINELDNGEWRFTISKRKAVWRFLEEVYDYSVIRHDALEVILNEIKPRMEDDEHLYRQGFMELMQFVDEARKHTERDAVKYDWQYFNEKWFDGALPGEDEIDQDYEP